MSVGATLKAGKSSSRRFFLLRSCCGCSLIFLLFLPSFIAYEQAIADGKSPDEIKVLLTAAFDTATTGAAASTAETPGETPPAVDTPPVVEDVNPVIDNVDASTEAPVVVTESEAPVIATESEAPVPVDEVKA